MLVILFICLFLFFSYKIFIKDFSATTATKILKFNTNIGYDLLYWVRENQHAHSCHSLYLSIFLFLPIKVFVTDFSAPVRARVFKFCIHLQRVEIYRKRKPQCWNLFCFLFSFFTISYSNIMHRETCVKNFTWTTAPRILKFCTNIGYDYLYCVK